MLEIDIKESVVMSSPISSPVSSSLNDVDHDITNKYNPDLHSNNEQFVQNNFWKLGIHNESQIV